ncbi:GNAT family N-acetyltransferase [Actinoplanes friuliensis]|uniref:Arginase/agmatinase/formimionoglutamate hydrolase arginase family-like protein n=1 Tax=Actinoplanes friuliensis DSM 7358 TaxID=1246995 RepID=U5VSN1_9ACTN|nr:GNAT family N-acetyltransferase [Actinoplanes friuliensis]AGZ39874.1 arginase/agmatinase/formimionoglutamate hydrolase arginase family-like protein [Actinoplanes friuliensis DSM 7358]
MLTGSEYEPGGRAVDAWAIELAAAAAWPATEVEKSGGWLLRHTPGVPRRRSNSALPPPAPAGLDEVEAFYRARELPVTIQVSPAEHHAQLDAHLAARGYRREAPTLVLTAPAVAEPPRHATDVTDHSTDVTDHSTAEWLAAYRTLSGDAIAVLENLPEPAAFVRVGDRAIGLFVATGGWAGVFCMATDPRHRRQGLASAVLRAGARWAVAQGVAGLYLQVEEGNRAARSLYARAGFTSSHSYHYRIAERD